MSHIPQLTDWQKEALLTAMREQVSRRPAQFRYGFWSVTFPTNAEIRQGSRLAQREYVADIVGDEGILVVRDLDGREIVRGALGWIWNKSIFDDYRARPEFQKRA